MTYFEAGEDTTHVWAAIDFGEPRVIGSLRYISRNDDNSIRIDDRYELFYWDGGWRSLGSMTGDKSHILGFKDVPSQALYLLKNHTRGKEERPFTYENGHQMWW